MKLLALDLATTTGWAVGVPTTRPTFGSQSFEYAGRHTGKCMSHFSGWLASLLDKWEPDHVCFEQPFMGRNPRVVRKLHGFSAITEATCFHKEYLCWEATIGDVREYFIGRRGGRRDALKADTISKCRELGWMVTTDDEADACAVWSFACAQVSKAHADGTLGLWNAQAGEA